MSRTATADLFLIADFVRMPVSKVCFMSSGPTLAREQKQSLLTVSIVCPRRGETLLTLIILWPVLLRRSASRALPTLQTQSALSGMQPCSICILGRP